MTHATADRPSPELLRKLLGDLALPSASPAADERYREALEGLSAFDRPLVLALDESVGERLAEREDYAFVVGVLVGWARARGDELSVEDAASTTRALIAQRYGGGANAELVEHLRDLTDRAASALGRVQRLEPNPAR